MTRLLFTKWWVILIQGILLILASIFVFRHPGGVLLGLSVWFGLATAATGVLGILAWFMATKEERGDISLLWNLLTALLGFALLFNLLATMKLVTILFAVWMIMTAVRLFRAGWLVKEVSFFGWVMVLAGALSAVVGVMTAFNIGLGAVGVATVVGLQVLVTGIGMVALAFVKKTVVDQLKERFHARVESLRSTL
jgi:uncharacterized membrane protein HdeD (DUF308 family)